MALGEAHLLAPHVRGTQPNRSSPAASDAPCASVCICVPWTLDAWVFFAGPRATEICFVFVWTLNPPCFLV